MFFLCVAGKGGQDTKKQEKKQEKKKESAKKAALEPVEELDAADAALAAEPKQKDPFDELPKG